MLDYSTNGKRPTLRLTLTRDYVLAFELNRTLRNHFGNLRKARPRVSHSRTVLTAWRSSIVAAEQISCSLRLRIPVNVPGKR